MTHLSLCSGIGGLDLAAEWAGFETVAQCEIDTYASKVLAKNFPGVPNLHDIRTVTNERLLSSESEHQPSYRQGSPVNPTALQEKVSAIVTIVTSGVKLQECSEKFVRAGSSVRIRPVYLQEAISGTSVECLMTLPRLGIRLAGEYGELVTSALRTSGTGCSFWRTPTASDGAFSQRTGETLARRWTEQKQKHLSEQVAYLENAGGQTYRETFLTPMASDGKRTKLPNSALYCMYKEESGYINSATSGTVIYTGGMNMTNEEMIENLKCVIADIFEQCEQLKAENAALRERLGKAVELPRVECIMTREWLSRELIGSIMFEWCALYKKGGYLMAEPCLSKEAAEIRLAELKGGKE